MHFSIHRYWPLLAAAPTSLDPCPSPRALADKAPNEAHQGGASPAPTLKYVFDCLLSPKASPKVCGCVMEMAVNLLTLESGERGGGAGDGRMETETAGTEGEDGSSVVSGEDLLSPFLPCLLEYLNRVIGENVGGKRERGREKGRCLENEFVVLSR